MNSSLKLNWFKAENYLLHLIPQYTLYIANAENIFHFFKENNVLINFILMKYNIYTKLKTYQIKF